MIRLKDSRALLGLLVLPLLLSSAFRPAREITATARLARVVSVPTHSQSPHRDAPRPRDHRAQAINGRKGLERSEGSTGSRSWASRKETRKIEGYPAPSRSLPSKDSLLTELTKPAYLHVRLLATPTNHRAPPA